MSMTDDEELTAAFEAEYARLGLDRHNIPFEIVVATRDDPDEEPFVDRMLRHLRQLEPGTTWREAFGAGRSAADLSASRRRGLPDVADGTGVPCERACGD